MNQWGYEENDATETGDNTELSGPKALRQAYEAMKRQNDELNSKLTSFLEEQTKSKMATVFESLGVPGAQDVYQGPADPEKAKAWVDTMRGVFGSNQGGTPPVAEQPVEPALPASMQAQYQRMTEAGQTGVPMGNLEAAGAAVGSANNLSELIAAMQNAQRMG